MVQCSPQGRHEAGVAFFRVVQHHDGSRAGVAEDIGADPFRLPVQHKVPRDHIPHHDLVALPQDAERIEFGLAVRRAEVLHGLAEGISTRLLVNAGQLIRHGIAPRDAARMAMVRPITDDADIRESLDHAIDAVLG